VRNWSYDGLGRVEREVPDRGGHNQLRLRRRRADDLRTDESGASEFTWAQAEGCQAPPAS